MAKGLTDAAIKAAQPKEKRYTMFDTGGLYLEIAPAGGKWWRLRYRMDGKTVVTSLGVYPKVSLKMAREKRDSLRTILATGGDPKAEKHIRTFKEVMDGFLELKRKTWASSTEALTGSSLKRLPNELLNSSVAKLDVQDFLKIFKKIESEGKVCVARRVMMICKTIMKYAKLSGYIKFNPIEDIALLLTPYKSENHPIITDPDKLGGLLYKIFSDHKMVSHQVSTCLRILPYVFVRINELCGARWEEVNLDTATWTIPKERMKGRREHIVPLAKQVVLLFKSLSTNSQFCFPGVKNSEKFISSRTVLELLRNLGYTRQELCLHSFRGIASTLLNEMGYRPDLIEAQLAHVDSNSIRAVYNRATYIDERRKMMQDWADYLDKLRLKV